MAIPRCPEPFRLPCRRLDVQSKGQPAGHVLFCLWARSPDHPLVTIENPATFASEAGFLGERAIDTWRRRMKKLRELGFIITKPGASGEFHYILLVNPNAILEWMHGMKLMQDSLYARFIDRAIEVGAYSDIEAVRAFWKEQQEAAAKAAADHRGRRNRDCQKTGSCKETHSYRRQKAGLT